MVNFKYFEMFDMICYREVESDIVLVDDVYNMCFLVIVIKKIVK